MTWLTSKTDILRIGELTDLQLVIGFSLAGSENIATHVGWFQTHRSRKAR
jgi:hypothetical protein